MSDARDQAPARRSKFPPLFWLAIVFEFFERGAYYGVMSALVVYLTDELGYSKTDTGLLTGTVTPLIYFMPIVAGALADRFGFRRMLFAAFALLGGGYALASQAHAYAAMFGALFVMGLGAGTFKPIISGTIARTTDPTNGALGFGIFYWSINLGALLVPLILVPLLRSSLGFAWVLIAASLGTGILLLPTALFYREPPRAPAPAGAAPAEAKPGLLLTLARAFEIIYSPVVLLGGWARRSRAGLGVTALLVLGLLGWGTHRFLHPAGATRVVAARAQALGVGTLVVEVAPNLCRREAFALETEPVSNRALLKLFRPERLAEDHPALARALGEQAGFLGPVPLATLAALRDAAAAKVVLEVRLEAPPEGGFQLEAPAGSPRALLRLADRDVFRAEREAVLRALQAEPRLAGLPAAALDELVGKASARSFFVLFLGLMLLSACLALRLAPLAGGLRGAAGWLEALGALGVLYAPVWLLPDLSLYARILSSVLGLTLLALFLLEREETARYRDHARFLAMIAIYSGFWVLYFQMFGTVLWYVQAYVDASALDALLSPVMNGLFGFFGLERSWRFDVEFVTVINAFTIVCLQLLVSHLVKRTRPLPTMVAGILIATAGMALLSLSTGIWVFLAGVIIFSLGEMTAHPKFIAYVGQIAPPSRVAMYMGYLFLYGVLGSSVGGVLGAELYVRYVDELGQPRALWLIFAGLGLCIAVGLVLYDRLVSRRQARPA
ncbi:MAG TPA: MFS transporter [Myxococcota bacterium]|nr:MFS transporter [Myxococcota bacterium]HRY93218.1 MFS transporter [Myxococcota bacterium]HSA21009.1 MFS transporter [Myxococcota bacterium]